MRYNKNINSYILSVWVMLLLVTFSFRVSAQSCKVELASLTGSYEGACKNGFANGKGEAIGVHHYTGFFKNGLPDGKGAYYFNDNTYYSGNFQDGIKEGKGEMHYIRKNLPDSIIKGYWSGDEYKGKVYKTYSFITSETFDSYDITPTEQSGNSITIDLSTTTGAPNGTRVSLMGAAKSGFILSLSDIISTNNCVLTKVVSNTTTSKSSYTYTLSKFPAVLFMTLSNGRTIDLELYKAAKWNVRLYLNK
jgi:hypothetical protein